MRYPLVICYIAIKNDHRNSGFTLIKNGGSFHSYVNVYRRVFLEPPPFPHDSPHLYAAEMISQRSARKMTSCSMPRWPRRSRARSRPCLNNGRGKWICPAMGYQLKWHGEYDGNMMGIWWEYDGNMMGIWWEYDDWWYGWKMLCFADFQWFSDRPTKGIWNE